MASTSRCGTPCLMRSDFTVHTYFTECLLCAMRSDSALAPSSSVDVLCWQGITNAIFVTALDKAILLRQYAISLKKSGTRVRLPPGMCSLFS